MPAAKRKTTARKVATKTSTGAPLDKISAECRKRFGWDPRITLYETDKRKLEEMKRDRENFTFQHARFSEMVVLFGYEIVEVGALADPKTRANQRIVQVTPAKKEAIAEE